MAIEFLKRADLGAYGNRSAGTYIRIHKSGGFTISKQLQGLLGIEAGGGVDVAIDAEKGEAYIAKGTEFTARSQKVDKGLIFSSSGLRDKLVETLSIFVLDPDKMKDKGGVKTSVRIEVSTSPLEHNGHKLWKLERNTPQIPASAKTYSLPQA